MVETLCDSGAVKLRAGINAAVLTTAQYTQIINQAEGDIIAETRVNWIDIYSTMNADFKQVLQGACAAKAAIKVIEHDPDAIGKSTAGFMVNILWAEYNQAIKALAESKVVTAFGASYINS